MEDVEERDLYLGNTIVVLSRQLKITDYADAFTQEQITSKRQRYGLCKVQVLLFPVILNRDNEIFILFLLPLYLI